MGAGVRKRFDVIADDLRVFDVDQRAKSLCLRRVKLVFASYRLGIVDDALTQSGIRAHLEEQLVQRIGFGWWMLVKLEPSVLELESSVLFGRLFDRSLSFSPRKKAHVAMSVMPGRRILHQLAGRRTDGAEHGGPLEHFRVSHFVELRRRHVQ